MPQVSVERHAEPELSALAWMRAERGRLGLEHVQLEVDRVSSRAGAATVRFAQRHGGVRVEGGGVTVRVRADGRPTVASVGVADGLTVDPSPSVDAAEAFARLRAAAGTALPSPERSELVVLPTDRGRLVWLLDLRVGPGGTRFVVDAHSGELVHERSLAVHAMGRVYEVSSANTPDPVDVELATLDEEADPLRLTGWGGLLTVTNYVSGGSQSSMVLEQSLGPSEGSDFLYDPPSDPLDPNDAFAQVNLFHHLTTIRELFRGLGVPVDAPAYKLTAVANARENGQPMDNAFFSPMGQTGTFAAPSLIAIGQGTQVDFAYDSDVFKHEFGHYVSHVALGYNLGQVHADAYGLSPHSGSIDEGIADYFACSQNGDAVVGEASLAVLGAARDLEAIDKTCPDDVFGQVHMDGEIVGALGWSVRKVVGAERGDRIVWGAMELLNPGARLGDFGAGVLATAEELHDDGELSAAELTSIRGLVSERGLDDCGAVLAIDGEASRRGTIIGLGIVGQAFGVGCQQVKGFGISLSSLFQFSRATEPGDAGLRIDVGTSVVQGSGAIELTLYARKGQPVRFGSGPGGIPSVSQFDHAFPLAGPGEAVLDATSDPPFEPGAEYYFALVSDSCPTLSYTVSASVAEPVGGEGGGDPGEGGGDTVAPDTTVEGCSCRAVGTSGHRGWWPSVLLGLALAGRAWRRRPTPARR